MKKTSNTLVFYYQEAIIQMGYICFFGCTFTLAPFASVLTNLIEIRIKLNSLAHYSRRFPAQPANDIGNWEGIIQFIALFTIPINIYIMLLLGQDPLTEANKDGTPWDERSNSVVMEWLLT